MTEQRKPESTLKPALRFKGFTDPWEQRKLGDHLEVSTEKNGDLRFGISDVYSVSWTAGVVNQIEFQGRSYAGGDLGNYDVVNTGEVVYTKSPLGEEPYGIIKSNDGPPGIVSQLYAVYRTKDGVRPRFVEHYFSLVPRLNQYFRPLVNKGAKNTMNISDKVALEGSVVFPGVDEQVRIAEVLNKLDSLITLHQREVDILKNVKQGLLDKMFV